MRNEFTAIVEQDGPWHIAYCAEVPGANVKALRVKSASPTSKTQSPLSWSIAGTSPFAPYPLKPNKS